MKPYPKNIYQTAALIQKYKDSYLIRLLQSGSPAHRHSLPAVAWCPWAGNTRRPMSSLGQHFSQISILDVLPHPAANP